METVKIHDKKFSESISNQDIQSAVEKIALKLNKDLENKDVIFIAVLNGAFMFAADLMKHIDLNCRITFLKLASYDGTEQSGTINQLIGLNETIKDKTVVIIEDIVDSGDTLNMLLNLLDSHQPSEVKLVSLLFKPDSFKYQFPLDYIGFHIPNKFVVGYGLDYDGFGRNLDRIYSIEEEF